MWHGTVGSGCDRQRRLDPRQQRRGARDSRPGSRSSARRRAPGSARRPGTCRSRRGSADRRGAVAQRRDPRPASRAPAGARSTSSAHRATRGRRRPSPGRSGRRAARRRPSAAATVLCDLVPAVDGEQVRVGAGDPHEERRAVDHDPPVRVRQPGRDPLGDDLTTRPVGDRRDDLVDRGWHAERVAQRLPFEGGTREGRHHRRRGRRDEHRLPPRGARLDRHRPRRPRRADLRIDLPLGRPGRPAPGLGDAHQDDDVRLRPLPAPRRRDRHRPLVARGRLAPPGVDAGALRGAPAPGGLGQDVRPAARADHRRGGPGPLPADVDRRRPRRRLAADRRLARPVGARQRAGRGRAPEGRPDPRPRRGSSRSARTAAGSPA